MLLFWSLPRTWFGVKKSKSKDFKEVYLFVVLIRTSQEDILDVISTESSREKSYTQVQVKDLSIEDSFEMTVESHSDNK
ncbi:MAG: hypothetical protein WCE54_13480 [Ignavibacteriaceae bacterium]